VYVDSFFQSQYITWQHRSCLAHTIPCWDTINGKYVHQRSNTINNTNYTTRIGATNTPSIATTSGTMPTSMTVSQQFPGPYRDEDVLLGLQLLGYLSNYPHVRQAFFILRLLSLLQGALAIWLLEEVQGLP